MPTANTASGAYNPKEGSKPYLFLKLASPDSDGYSREVFVSEFKGEYTKLRMGNGGDWCRDDSTLGKYYNITRNKTKGKNTSIKLNGHKKGSDSKPIPRKLGNKIRKKRCSILAIGGNQIQVDHKDGRRDDPRLSDVNRVTEDDLQPLSQAANSAKRQHCKECRETEKRFDAKRLGYTVSQTKGNDKYRGSCVGCYWHDPKAFNKMVSENFKKIV